MVSLKLLVSDMYSRPNRSVGRIVRFKVCRSYDADYSRCVVRVVYRNIPLADVVLLRRK